MDTEPGNWLGSNPGIPEKGPMKSKASPVPWRFPTEMVKEKLLIEEQHERTTQKKLPQRNRLSREQKKTSFRNDN